MGEKKMLQKERKSPSQKKKAVAPAKPESGCPYSFNYSCSCPSISNKTGSDHMRSKLISDSISGMGGITKSWISSPSSACRDRIHQTWPQLVQINCSPEDRGGFPVYSGRVIEPYSGNDRYNVFAEFINYIDFQGKFYAISLQGRLAVVEGSDPHLEITGLGRNRVVPYCKESRHFREYLLEYDGNIYLVFLLSRVSINKVDGVEVFRLDTSRLSWEKVDRLKGDAMFFVEDDGCMGILASLLGCNSKGSNCVYFTHDRADGHWFVYDMETNCISVTSGPEIDHPIPESRRR